MTPEIEYFNGCLNSLFETAAGDGYVIISPHVSLDGEGTVFRLYRLDSHTCRITTDKSFAEWYGYASTGYEGRYAALTDALCKRCGLEWDAETLTLSITFRRNQYGLAEALMRLENAVLFFGGLIFSD